METKKLVELLDSADLGCVKAQCHICGYYDSPWKNGKQSLCRECRVAEHLLANGVRLETEQATSDENKRWIPVTERLPEGGKVVLCYKKDRKMRFGRLLDATYADGVQAFLERDNVLAFGVTHWMPLPEGPKEEDNA